MAGIIEIVDAAIRAAGIPIDGISIGDLADRTTWTAHYQPAATPAQRAQAATLLLTLPIDATVLHARDQQTTQAAIDALPIFEKAIVLALIDQLNVLRAALPAPLPPITPAQAIAAIRAKAGTL